MRTFADSSISTRRSAGNHPGVQNWTLALFKDFAIREGHGIKFRTEFFNWPNHPNWTGLDTNPRSGSFGKVSSKNHERVIQFSLRYNF